MVRVTTQVIEAHVIGEGEWLAVTEVCRMCRIERDAVHELAALGLVTPRERRGELELPAAALARLRTVSRLMRDLGINASGAVLAVELLERIRELERRS